MQHMQQMQYDVYSLQAERLLPVLLPHVPQGPERSLLEAWDLRYSPDSTAATLFEGVREAVVEEVLGGVVGRDWVRRVLAESILPFFLLGPLDDVICRAHSRWLAADRRGEVLGRAVRRALQQSVEPWASAILCVCGTSTSAARSDGSWDSSGDLSRYRGRGPPCGREAADGISGWSWCPVPAIVSLRIWVPTGPGATCRAVPASRASPAGTLQTCRGGWKGGTRICDRAQRSGCRRIGGAGRFQLGERLPRTRAASHRRLPPGLHPGVGSGGWEGVRRLLRITPGVSARPARAGAGPGRARGPGQIRPRVRIWRPRAPRSAGRGYGPVAAPGPAQPAVLRTAPYG